MRVELGFDNSLCLVEIERLELRITGFTDADYGNVLRYDPEITFWHGHSQDHILSAARSFFSSASASNIARS